MEVVLLPSTVGGGVGQCLSSYLINGCVAIDAGGVGLFGSIADQARIGHVFLTHSHIDHVATLPILLDNVYGLNEECVTVYGSRETLDCLQSDVFNDRLWPDFLRISRQGRPFLRIVELESGRPVTVAGLRVTPVLVDHVVPTFAYLVEDDRSAIAIVTDTAPTEEVWRRARAFSHLRGVFLEASFPAELDWLAVISGHLTTSKFRTEVQKAPPGASVVAVHIKPRYFNEVVAQLHSLNLPQVEIGAGGRVYRFDT